LLSSEALFLAQNAPQTVWRTRWGSLQRSLDPLALAGLSGWGPREGERGRDGVGKEGREGGRKAGGEGKGG